MIFDSLDNFRCYAELHPGFLDIQLFISTTDLAGLATGNYQINDNGAYASVHEYNSRPVKDCFIECHRKYIDVQIIVRGEEKIGFSCKTSCAVQPYDEEKDLQKLSGKVDFITMVPGLFAIFFPQDAHEPGVISGSQAVPVKKIVCKVPV
jgi:YhcH/YjgK/YiaL family protein